MSLGDGRYCCFNVGLELFVSYSESGPVHVLDELDCAHLLYLVSSEKQMLASVNIPETTNSSLPRRQAFLGYGTLRHIEHSKPGAQGWRVAQRI